MLERGHRDWEALGPLWQGYTQKSKPWSHKVFSKDSQLAFQHRWPQGKRGAALTGILLGYFIRISVTSCILVAVEEKRKSDKRSAARHRVPALLLPLSPVTCRGFSSA